MYNNNGKSIKIKRRKKKKEEEEEEEPPSAFMPIVRINLVYLSCYTLSLANDHYHCIPMYRNVNMRLACRCLRKTMITIKKEKKEMTG